MKGKQMPWEILGSVLVPSRLSCSSWITGVMAGAAVTTLRPGGESLTLWRCRTNATTHLWTCRSVQFSHSVMSHSSWPHELHHARPPCPSPISRVHLNPCPSKQQETNLRVSFFIQKTLSDQSIDQHAEQPALFLLSFRLSPIRDPNSKGMFITVTGWINPQLL